MTHIYRNLRNLSLVLCTVPLVAIAADRDNTANTTSDPARKTAPTMPVPSGGAPSAPGTGTSAQTPPLFAELDTNKDGQVTKEEAKRSAEVQARFDEFDTNRDGKISTSEWQSATRQ